MFYPQKYLHHQHHHSYQDCVNFEQCSASIRIQGECQQFQCISPVTSQDSHHRNLFIITSPCWQNIFWLRTLHVKYFPALKPLEWNCSWFGILVSNPLVPNQDSRSGIGAREGNRWREAIHSSGQSVSRQPSNARQKRQNRKKQGGRLNQKK